MIHVHRWKGLTAGNRESWVEVFTPGMLVGDVRLCGPLRPAHLGILRNGRPCSPNERLDDHDHLDLVLYPMDPISISQLIVTLVISTAISFAIRALMPEPEKAVERGDERSPTHGFGAVANIRAEGQPIQVVYGEHLMAGTILNEFVEVDNSTGESTYFAIIDVGEGPVESIGGQFEDTVDTDPLTSKSKTTPNKIFLQGNPLANFHQTKVWVRLGSNEQTLVPGFEKNRATFVVGVELTSPDVGVSDAADLIPAADFGVGGDAGYEAHWDDFGFAWDVPIEDVDGTEVIMNFTGGLYRVTDLGTFEPSRWVLGIRYAKLDGNGNVILGPGTGGNADDGWVRLPHEEFNLDRQNQFQLAFPVAFFDPTAFIAPIPGDSFHITSWAAGGGGHFLESISTLDNSRTPANWTNVVPAYTFECWVAWDETGSSGPFSGTGEEFLCMNEWSSDGLKDGVWCGFKLDGTGKWQPHFQVGKWGRNHTWPDVSSFIRSTTDAADKKWNHLVWSHKRFSSNTNITRFWINSVYMGEFEQNIDIITPDPVNSGSAFAPMTFGHSTKIIASDYSAKVWWDEIIVHNEFFSTSDVQLRWNGGEGIRHSDADPDLVVLLHIEGGLTDSTGFGNDFALTGFGNLGVGNGKITKQTSPTRTRGRYRVQCVRINGESVTGGDRRQDDAEWQLSVTWLDQAFVYPGIAYTAIEVEATEQLNTSAPTITQIVRGQKPRIWDRISTIAPSFARRWTKNTAWIAMDIATDENYGGGQAFALENVDLESVALLSDRCEKRVSDGRGVRDFYRQDYEAQANKCNSPVSIGDAFWASFIGGGPTVTLNTDEAPNGELEADTLGDTDVVNMEGLGFTFLPSTEPSFYSASVFILKDPTVTGHTSGIRISIPGSGSTTDIAFNIDNGQAVSGCTVEDYSDKWWLVKVNPFFYNNVGSIICYLLPASFTRNTNTIDNTLTGAMTAWGFSIHRGKNHVPYPGVSGARAYLFMANEDVAGDPQVIPEHWVVGGELRIRNANAASWNTDLDIIKALEILEILQVDVMDGYDRVWQIVVKWPTSQDAPSGSFPDLVQDGRDWDDIPGEWTVATGVTAAAELDDGGVTGGPSDPDPKLSTVCEIAGATAFTDPIEQFLPASIGTQKLTARAHIYKPDTGTNPQLKVSASPSNDVLTDPPNIGWNKVEAVLDAADTTTTVGIGMAGAASTFWWDGLGCWVSEDSNGNVAGGTVEGAEALFEYDKVHDRFVDLWDTLIAVLLTARAVPVREGNRLRFKFEEPRDPVGLVTMSSVVALEGKSTFKVRYVNEKQRANSVVIDFNDQSKNWVRSPASVDDPALEANTDEGLVRRQSYFLSGVTRRSQVLRHALFNLAVNRTIIREGGFVSDPSAITYEPGDVVAIGHDVVPWGQGGRLTRSSAEGINVAEDSEDFSQWIVATGELAFEVNSMSTPDGRPTADRIETLVDSQVTLGQVLTDVNNAQPYTFSFRVKRLVGSRVGIQMIQSGGDNIAAEYDWELGTFTQITSVTGVTLSLRLEADGWVRIGIDILSASANEIECFIIAERASSAFLGTILWLADAQIERSVTEPSDYDRPGKGIWIDRQVNLEVGETYLCRVVSGTTGKTGEGQVQSGAGLYEIGDSIELVNGSLAFTPKEGDLYLFYTDAERMEVMISSLQVREDLAVDVDWVQHDDSIHDGDDLDEELFQETFDPGGDGSNTADPNHGTLIPGAPIKVSAIEMGTTGPSGIPQSMLDVAWTNDPDTARDVTENRIFLAFLDEETLAWTQPRLVGTAPGSASSIQVPLMQTSKLKLCWVMVQPVSYGGARTAPRQLVGQVLELGGRYPAPQPPTNFLAHMEGDRIVYTWDPPADNEGLVYEIRHSGASPKGGWVLALKVVETADTQFGPTTWWSSAQSTARPYYYLRSRNKHGVYSDAVAIQYTARVQNDERLDSTNHWWSLISQAWHSYSDGWVTDTAPPAHDPNLNNLQRHADGYIEFSGSSLTGTYKTASLLVGETPDTFEIEERLRLEVMVLATCLNKKVIGGSNINSDGTTKKEIEPLAVRVVNPWGGNETVEGDLQEDLPSITVQMKLVRELAGSAGATPIISAAPDSGGSSGWIDWKPGDYVCHGAQFRITLTRPTADWDVRIWEFYTAAYRILPERHYRTPLESRLARRHGLG